MLSQIQVPLRQEQASPQENGERERKRRRKALSCYDCRRRKLRCDRSFPSCSRCSKAGLASNCRYETGPSESRHGQEDSVTDDDYEHARLPPITNSDGMTGRLMPGESISSQNRRISQLEDRIAHLEAALSHTHTPSNHHPLSPASMVDAPRSTENPGPKESETMIFRHTSFRTQYYGASHDTAHLVHFPEFFRFAKDSSSCECPDNSLKLRLRSDMKALTNNRKEERVTTLEKINGDLFSLLPSREEVDHLIRLYFDTLETTYRIIHQPTFWKEYRQFWLDPKQGSLAFVAILLLAMATVRCVSTKKTPQYAGDSTTERETASLHISACDNWLRVQSVKHSTIKIYQAHCLLILARVMNEVKTKQAWTFTGTSLRVFMSAGLHRNSNSVLKGVISEFDKEMRRRLWSTMAELELEAAIMRGMPTILGGLRTDCGCPQNINDEDFEETSPSIPSSRPSTEHTSTSFLYLSQKSFPLRVTLAALVNDSNMPLLYEDVLMYEKKIMQQLQLIPRWTEGTSATRPNSALLEALLDMQLRQFLIILHYPFARRSGSNHQQDYSRMACFNAASSIIKQYAKFAEAGQYTLLGLRNDVYRAALCLCQMCSLVPNNPSTEIISTSSIQLVEQALNVLERRVLQFGQGYKKYAFVSAAYGLALSKTTNKSVATLQQETLDRFIKLFEKVTSAQRAIFQPFLISSGGISKYPPPPDGIENHSNRQSNAGTPFFTTNNSIAFDIMQDANQQFFNFDLFDWNVDDFSFDVASG